MFYDRTIKRWPFNIGDCWIEVAAWANLTIYLYRFICMLWLSWSWSLCSWIYNYLWNQCLSPLMLWVRISIRARCTTLCDKVCKWLKLATGRWFSRGTLVSSTNKTDHHHITEKLLKVALNTIKQTNNTIYIYAF